MKKIIVIYLLLIFNLLAFNLVADDKNNSLTLSNEELAYLQNKKVLNASASENYRPYDFVENRRPTGYSTEYVRLLSKKLGIKLNFIIGQSWNESVQQFCDRKIDILHATNLSKRVKQCGNISLPQIKDNRLIVTRKNGFEKVSSSKDLIGYRMVTPKGWGGEDYYKKLYGDKIQYIRSNDIEEALAFIREGKADFTTASSNVLQYFILKNGYTNLIFHTNDVRQSDNEKENDNLYIASRKDEPLLQSIINKAMKSISIGEMNELQKPWLGNIINTEPKLTDAEKQYLNTKTNLTLCIDPVWKPIDYIDKNGKHAGIGSFFIKDIEKSLAIKFKLLQTKTWHETLENIKANKCDVVSTIQKSEHREKFFNFTMPYLTKQSVLITQKDIPYIDNIGLLKNKKIGVTQGFIAYDLLRESFNNLKLIEYNSLIDGLVSVEKGEIFGFVDLSSTANYMIQNRGLNLKISASTGIPVELALGVDKNNIVLFDLMKKALQNIDEATKLKYSNLYSNITYEKVIDYSLIWKVLFIATFLIVIFAYWNRKLSLAKKMIEERNKELDKLLLTKSRQATFGSMIDTISHQWKQPLNELGLQMMYIDTQLKLYNKVPSKETLKKNIDKSKNILEFMSLTVDVFRNFFKTCQTVSEVNISKTINNTILFLESTFVSEHIKITKAIESNVMIIALEEELAHSILNILVNAKDIFKQRDIKKPQIEVSLITQNNQAIITIKDNAGGIKINPLEAIFQSGVSTNKNGGIGLYISYKIITERLGGMISVENCDEGATFSIAIPIVHQDSKAKTKA